MKVLMFRTERLQVRRMAAADVHEMAVVYGDADAMRWVGDGQPLSAAQCQEWLQVTERNYATRGYGMSVIQGGADGEVLGFCGLVHPGGQTEAEIKYALKRHCWGRGFATEAAAGLLAWGAREMGLQSVIATAAPDNTASHRVLLKAGMVRGALRDNGDGSFTQLFEWRAPRASAQECMTA